MENNRGRFVRLLLYYTLFINIIIVARVKCICQPRTAISRRGPRRPTRGEKMHCGVKIKNHRAAVHNKYYIGAHLNNYLYKRLSRTRRDLLLSNEVFVIII